MARRIATARLLRHAAQPLLPKRGVELGDLRSCRRRSPGARMFALMGSLTIPLAMDDGDALLDFAGRDPAAGKGKIATLGYCMSGQYAINFAARYPRRVAAAASIYGVRLVTDQADSPHLAAQRPRPSSTSPAPSMTSTRRWRWSRRLDQTVKSKALNAEVELYRGVHHGFAFPAAAGLRQAGRRTPLGAAVRAVEAAAGLGLWGLWPTDDRTISLGTDRKTVGGQAAQDALGCGHTGGEARLQQVAAGGGLPVQQSRRPRRRRVGRAASGGRPPR